MQRVVSINLNGNAYQLEENGYNALFAYLDAVDAQLTDDPERPQKLADLERRAAEKCDACLGPHKTVVTAADVDRLVLELGPVPGAPASEPAASSAGPSSSSSSSSSSGPSRFAHRRLYQIREGAMISGVCVGLSEFLRIDVTLIRILFVVFALASAGWGLLVYGVLMFVVPHVNTRADAAEGVPGAMPPHHWPWDGGWPWDTYGWPWDQPTPAQQANREARDARQQTLDGRPPAVDARQQARDARQQARDARRAWRAQERAARHAYYGHGGSWGFFGVLFSLMFVFFWISVLTRGRFFYGWPFFWGFPHWIGIVMFFVILRLVFMPFRAARWYGYGPYGPSGPYPHPHYAWISMWNTLAWLVLLAFGIWFAYQYIPDVHDFIRSFQTSWTPGGLHV
ncbi:MAG TPA: PspC domain-containing protein [Vicinamibacterales bacterium]|nr:PspC domain-containing protein [Vicinamibacterales bacterium]